MNSLLETSDFYRAAKDWVVERGFAGEIEWQKLQEPSEIDESEFLREAAWVIYCSGFRESTVRQHFDFISLCFCDWTSAQEIVESGQICINSAMRGIANRPKHTAVLTIAKLIVDRTFSEIRHRFLNDPIGVFKTMPFLGPITSVHLAKNLGFEFAKPDRHLVRLKDRLGFSDVDEMCRCMARSSGDAIRVVDLVLWRYMERNAVCT